MSGILLSRKNHHVAEALPTRCRIRGQWWRIVVDPVSMDGEALLGFCDLAGRRLLVSPYQTTREALGTLLHEMAHAAVGPQPLVSCVGGLEEAFVARMERPLLEALQSIGWAPKASPARPSPYRKPTKASRKKGRSRCP